MNDRDFKLRPGLVAVKFRHHGFDDLGMTLDIRGEIFIGAPTHDDELAFARSGRTRRRRIATSFSSTEDGLPDLVSWLAAVSTGVQRCSVLWNAEGPDGFLAFEPRSPGSREGTLTASWSGGRREGVELLVDRRQMVAAFYQAFRRFVRSPRYHPQKYEARVRFGDLLARENPDGLSEEEIVGHAVMLDRESVEKWLNGIRAGPGPLPTLVEGTTWMEHFERPDPPSLTPEEAEALFSEAPFSEPTPPRTRQPRRPQAFEAPKRLGWAVDAAKQPPACADFTDGYTHPLWNRMNTARRRQCIREAFDRFHEQWHGANLRELRSDVIERWLGWVAPEDA